jgi:quinohemoprotein ethanol dehydrogenase
VAIDPELGMMYFSTGNTGPDYDGSVRPGDNLFAASIVALDYRTGQYRWHFQEVRHDIWDYDAPSPVVLFEQTYNGVQRTGLSQPGKTGWIYYLDRTNGEPLIGMEYRPVPQDPRQATADTQPFPVGDKFGPHCADPWPGFPLAGCMFDPFWDIPVVMPGSIGNWSPSSFSPLNGFTYVMGQNGLSGRAMRPEAYERGKRYTAGANVTPPDWPTTNTVTAMDSRTNTIVWQKELPGARSYGAVSTAGNLVFVGQADGNLVAYDSTTGQELWKFQTGWGISAPPMSYEVDGVQYVAVASGGNRGGITTLDGDAVWSFSLNGVIDELPSPGQVSTRATVGGNTRIGDAVGNAATTVGAGWISRGPCGRSTTPSRPAASTSRLARPCAGRTRAPWSTPLRTRICAGTRAASLREQPGQSPSRCRARTSTTAARIRG